MVNFETQHPRSKMAVHFPCGIGETILMLVYLASFAVGVLVFVLVVRLGRLVQARSEPKSEAD